MRAGRAVMSDAETDTRRTRVALAVLHALAEWADTDAATLWWVARSASSVAGAEVRGAFSEALDLLEALHVAQPLAFRGARRWLAAGSAPRAN